MLLAISVCARGDDEIEKLLRRQLSPGVVALFVRQTADPRIAERLKIALTDNAAPVRGVAARVIAVGKLAGLLSTIKETLARETDTNAAAEEVRTFFVIGGSTTDPDVLAALKRFAPRLDGPYVRLIGRLRGAAALDSYFSVFRELTPAPSDRRAFFRGVADRDGPDALTAAAALAFSKSAAEDWAAVLAVAVERGAALKESVLITVLRTEEAGFRGEAAWYLARTYRGHPPQNAGEVLEAVSEERASSSDAESRFGSEILRRVLGKPAVEDEDWIASLRTNLHCHLDSDFFESPLAELLTERERKALFFRNTRPTDAARRQAAAIPEAPGTGLRLVSGLPSGLTEDLLLAGGCRSTSLEQFFSIADVEFEPDGLPRHVRRGVSSLKGDCRKTADAIFLMSTAPDDETFRAGHVVSLALFDPDCLICSEGAAALAGIGAASVNEEILRVRARVVAPKLEKRVEPSYPAQARRERQEGVSVYEAIVSPHRLRPRASPGQEILSASGYQRDGSHRALALQARDSGRETRVRVPDRDHHILTGQTTDAMMDRDCPSRDSGSGVGGRL